MKKKNILLIFVFLNIILKAQLNIVPNPGFEQVNNDIVCGNYADDRNVFSSEYEYWGNIEYWNLPRLPWYCALSRYPGSADVNCRDNSLIIFDNPAKSGKYCAHIINDAINFEYFVTELKEVLKSNTNYFFEFQYVVYNNSNSSFPSNKIGGIFFEEKPYQCSPDGKLNGNDYNPLFYSKANHKNNEWTRAVGYIGGFSQNTLKYLTMGVWLDSPQERFRFLFDDIKIIEIGTNFCPEKWLFDNINFDQGEESYQASNFIKAGRGADPEVEDGDVVVVVGSSLKLRAKNEIELLPGFEVQNGATGDFEVGVECSETPCITPVFNEKDFLVCNGESKTIDNVISNIIDPTWVFNWSPAQYFDDPHVANPVFNPPAGNGSIEVTVDVSNLCFTSYSKKYTINYASQLSDEAELNIENMNVTNETISFDVSVYSNTSLIKVEIPELNYLVGGKLVPNFGSTYHWSDPTLSLEFCKDYDIVVTSTNVCSGQSKSETIHFSKVLADEYEYNGVTTIVSMGDPASNKLLADVKGVARYTTFIKDSWGLEMCVEEGKIYKSEQSPIFDPSKCSTTLPSAQYEFVTYLFECPGQGGEQRVINGWFYYFKASATSRKADLNADSLYKNDILIDNNQIVGYSHENNTENITKLTNSFSVKENPISSGNLQLSFNLEDYDEVNVRVIDLEGKVVTTKSCALERGNTFETIYLENLQGGIYLVQAIGSSGWQQVERVVKY